MVPLQARLAALAANLAGPSTAPPVLRRPPSPDPPLDLNNEDLHTFHRNLIDVTRGFTIEQLEQVNAAVMDLVWKHRASWDRNEILVEAKEVLKDVLEDVGEMQRMAQASKLRAKKGLYGEEEVSYGEVLTSDLVEVV